MDGDTASAVQTRPLAAPPSFHLLAKPSGSTCNIDCAYCFFLSKEALYPNDKHRMSEATLESYIRQLLESHRTPEVTVAWQGGEPTLMKLEFFEQRGRTRRKIPQARPDGPADLPDQRASARRRLVRLLQEAQFPRRAQRRRAARAARRLPARPARARARSISSCADGAFWQAHGVEFNILCTVNAANETHGRESLSLLPRRTRREMDAVHSDRRAGDGGHARHRQPGLERSRERGQASGCSTRRPAISSPTARSGASNTGAF